MTTRMLAVAVLGIAITADVANAQTSVEPARALWAAADYEGALAALGTGGGESEAMPSLAADRLRALCLLALGRDEDAETVIARLVRSHPAYDPGDEVAPRIRIAFRAVRDRVVPAMARRLYDEGRAAFDSGAYADAVERFARALPAIEALAMEGRPRMEDWRVLANEFLALARQRVPPAEVRAPPLVARVWPVEPPALGPAAAAPDTAPTPPVAIEQNLPPWTLGPRGFDEDLHGAVEVRIDETGRVVDASLVGSVHPQYDLELLRAAKRWRYEPARRAGRPVASHQRIEVVLRAR